MNIHTYQNTFTSSSSSSSGTESLTDSLKDIITLLRCLNIKKILNIFQHVSQHLKTASDPISKILIIIEGLALYTTNNESEYGP